MIYENILKISDIIDSKFLTLQEGIVPTITFYSPEKYKDNILPFDKLIEEINKGRKYEIECVGCDSLGETFEYEIYPNWYFLDNKIAFVSKDFSVEEMIEIIVNLNK